MPRVSPLIGLAFVALMILLTIGALTRPEPESPVRGGPRSYNGVGQWGHGWMPPMTVVP